VGTPLRDLEQGAVADCIWDSVQGPPEIKEQATISRREFLQADVAASVIVGVSGFGNWSRLAAQQALTQDRLLQFADFCNVTLIHITDRHAQLKPVWFREPEINLGVGEAAGKPPHVT
jgi:sulfur-oxidizing protein SoxB